MNLAVQRRRKRKREKGKKKKKQENKLAHHRKGRKGATARAVMVKGERRSMNWKSETTHTHAYTQTQCIQRYFTRTCTCNTIRLYEFDRRGTGGGKGSCTTTTPPPFVPLHGHFDFTRLEQEEGKGKKRILAVCLVGTSSNRLPALLCSIPHGRNLSVLSYIHYFLIYTTVCTTSI